MNIKVTIEERDDGGIRVYSEDLKGLVLSGKNRTAIIADIEPAVRAILRHKGNEPESLRIDATFVQNDRQEKAE